MVGVRGGSHSDRTGTLPPHPRVAGVSPNGQSVGYRDRRPVSAATKTPTGGGPNNNPETPNQAGSNQ